MEKSLVENGSDTVPTPQQVENLWKSMTHQFKKTADHNNISGNNRKNCPYYEELNDIMGFRPNVKPVSTVGTMKRRTVENVEDGDMADERPEKKKRKYMSTSSVIGDKILEKMEELREERRKREEENRQLIERMHNDKMQILRDLVNVLKN